MIGSRPCSSSACAYSITESGYASPDALLNEAATLALSLSEQTFPLETRKLGLQETPLHLGLGAAREYREGSVSRAAVRRRNHVGIYCRSFNHLLVAWAFRISHIHRFNPPFACRRHHSSGFAFRIRKKGQRITAGSAFRIRDEEWCVRCHAISSPNLKSRTISGLTRGCVKEIEGF